MSNFNNIYDSIFNDNNQELKEIYTSIKKDRNIVIIIALSICLIMDYVFLKYIKIMHLFFYILMLLVDICIFFSIYIMLNYNEKYRNLQSIFKTKIIEKIINYFYTDVVYYYDKGMDEKYYRKIYNDYNIFKSDDYIIGKINNKEIFEIAEILTIAKLEFENSNGKIKIEKEKTFSGLFMRIKLDKSINSYIKIKQNKLISFDKDKIEMDSFEFEKYFDIKTSNKMLATRILTANVMESLVNYIKESKIKYEIDIINDDIFIRFHCGEMFEMNKINRSKINKKNIEKYYDTLKLTYNVSNEVLNAINSLY